MFGDKFRDELLKFQNVQCYFELLFVRAKYSETQINHYHEQTYLSYAYFGKIFTIFFRRQNANRVLLLGV